MGKQVSGCHQVVRLEWVSYLHRRFVQTEPSGLVSFGLCVSSNRQVCRTASVHRFWKRFWHVKYRRRLFKRFTENEISTVSPRCCISILTRCISRFPCECFTCRSVLLSTLHSSTGNQQKAANSWQNIPWTSFGASTAYNHKDGKRVRLEQDWFLAVNCFNWAD